MEVSSAYWRDRPTLVTGATGLLGSWLTRRLLEAKADVVCIQEIKAHAADLTDAMRNPGRLKGYFHFAEKKGYSGVGLYCRREPDRLIEGCATGQ